MQELLEALHVCFMLLTMCVMNIQCQDALFDTHHLRHGLAVSAFAVWRVNICQKGCQIMQTFMPIFTDLVY